MVKFRPAPLHNVGFLVLGFVLAALGGIAGTALATVSLAAPADGGTVSGMVTVSAGIGSGVQWVDFYIDGNYLTSSPPYTMQWNSTTVADGTHTISVAAFGAGDSHKGRAAVTVVVANGSQPQVVMTAPADGATLAGGVAINVQPGSQVQWVDFYIDGSYLTSSPPYDLTWDSTSVANGVHTISVTGFDPNDNVVGQQAVQVTIANGTVAATPAPTMAPAATPTPSVTPTPVSTPDASNAGPSYLATLGTLPPGSALPSGAECAKLISFSSWEPRPGNQTANQTVPDPSWLQSYYATVASGEGGSPGSYLQRVDGNFTGTTDEILQWAACKWGFDVNVVRAIAVNESWWYQDSINSDGPTYGILQIKISAGNYPSTDPYSLTSTAFNADYKLAQQRACFDGNISYLDSASYPNLSNTNYMLWGCVGQWYSGQWYDSGAQTYISQVKSYLQQETWAQPGF